VHQTSQFLLPPKFCALLDLLVLLCFVAPGRIGFFSNNMYGIFRPVHHIYAHPLLYQKTPCLKSSLLYSGSNEMKVTEWPYDRWALNKAGFMYTPFNEFVIRHLPLYSGPEIPGQSIS
jgi:hypothetical protein